MAHRPRKRFGQNFLQNQMVIHSIVQALHLQPTDHVVEIGPGLGALTKPLLELLPQLTAIEIDLDLQAHLSSMPGFSDRLALVNADALTVDFGQLGQNLRIIGNLPYNISTPLLLHLLQYLSCIEDMHFMLQKEVVLRLAASPGHKAYGRLSVMVQYHCTVDHLFDVPATAFYPQPKVESAVVRLTPHRPQIYPAILTTDLARVVATAFSMRRKTLANTLKPLITAADISALGINPLQRAEQLSVVEYIQLAKFIFN